MGAVRRVILPAAALCSCIPGRPRRETGAEGHSVLLPCGFVRKDLLKQDSALLFSGLPVCHIDLHEALLESFGALGVTISSALGKDLTPVRLPIRRILLGLVLLLQRGSTLLFFGRNAAGQKQDKKNSSHVTSRSGGYNKGITDGRTLARSP